MELTATLVVGTVLGLFCAGVIVLYVVTAILAHHPRKALESELFYLTNKNGNKEEQRLPNKNEYNAADGIELSVVVPCYNETQRIGAMLDEAIVFLQKEMPNKYEILIVDDGSSDDSSGFSLKIASKYGLEPGVFRVVKLAKNRGKGGAVTHGLQYTRGRYSIFADADGASKFSDVTKLLQAAKDVESKGKDVPAVAIGSRAHMVNTDAVVKRSFIRNFLMYSLHTLLYVFGIRTIKDTQCGFKLFNKAAVEQIFPFMHNEGWIFDVEVLILAIRKGITIEEVPISWHEVGGSKVDLAVDSVKMAVDLIVIRFAYMFGIYKDFETKKDI